MTKEVLSEFSELTREKKYNFFSGMLRTGMDLGIANIVVTVTDEDNHPVTGAIATSKVVKDGIVVDFVGATQTMRRLRVQLEESFGVPLETAATAVPPGTIEGNVGCVANVVEGAGFEVIHVIDEPTAAASVLRIRGGAVMGVGGGTAGVSILKDGEVIFAADEPTGGTHMILVLMEYYGISTEEVKKLRTDRDRERDIFPVIRPVIEGMASIAKGFPSRYEVNCVYVAGGASCSNEFGHTFEKALDVKMVKTNDVLLVIPLGIV